MLDAELDFDLDNGSKIAHELAGEEEPPRQEPRRSISPELPLSRTSISRPSVRRYGTHCPLPPLIGFRFCGRPGFRWIGLVALPLPATSFGPLSKRRLSVTNKGLWGHVSLVLADGLDEYVDDLRQAGVTALIISADDILDFQQRLRTSGFTPTQLEAAGFLHLSTDELEAMRQERIADSPEELAGDVFADLNQASSALREIAQALSVYDTGSSTQPDYEPQQ